MTPESQHPRVRVATACARQQIQEIHVRTGDGVAVGHRNLQHPAFVWCATEDGHHGWVPADYLTMTGEHSAVGRREYDSTHLTVVEDEELEELERVDDYVLCRNAAGVEGWVPAPCLRGLEER